MTPTWNRILWEQRKEEEEEEEDKEKLMAGGAGRWKRCCGWIEDDDDVVPNSADSSIEVTVVRAREPRIWSAPKWVHEVHCLKTKE